MELEARVCYEIHIFKGDSSLSNLRLGKNLGQLYMENGYGGVICWTPCFDPR
jgi:hypothetical protein